MTRNERCLGLRFAQLACLGALISAASAGAQETPARPAPPLGAEERLALRWARELELPRRRVEAFAELTRLEARAVPALIPLLDDPRPDVAIRAADVLLFLGHCATPALPALARVAATAPPEVAYACRLVHLRLSFEGVLTVGYEDGHARILEGNGDERDRVAATNAWDAELLPDARTLIGLYGSGDARELDGKGATVWEYTEPGSVYDCDRAPDGTTWVTCADLGVVRQIDAAGKMIWESPKLGRPVDVDALPSGRILITDYEGRIVEIDREGTIHWTLGNLSSPMDADRLPDGTTLIALYGSDRVQVVDHEGNVLREIEIENPQDADLVRNGCIAVAATKTYAVFDAAGNRIWERPGKYACEITWALDPNEWAAPANAETSGARAEGAGDRTDNGGKHQEPAP